MLIGLKEALDFGEQHNCGIAAINTPTFEMLVATINVAERYNIPMILQHAEVHEPVNSIENIGPAMVELAKRSTAPLVVHVDHGESYDFVKRGFDVGFNSAMISFFSAVLSMEASPAEPRTSSPSVLCVLWKSINW